MKTLTWIEIIFLALITGCEEQPPVMVEGDTLLSLTACWYSIPGDTTSELLPMSSAKVILSSEYGMQVMRMDLQGKIEITGLPSSIYSISVRMNHPDDETIQLICNQKDVLIRSGVSLCDSLIAKPISSSGIAINEIYSVGPVNSIFFFYDQYIELYNSGDSIKYLDGMMVMRFSSNNEAGHKGSGADEDDDNDIDGVTYAFRFPGSPGETNYPFYPKTFLVLASDAVNHKSSVSGSVDLSNAGWEFYNQYSATDIDNPNVPNLLNMRPDKTSDFLIGLTDDIIIVSSGADSVWEDGIDISTVIDGVEYQTSTNQKKTLDERVDRGFAFSPPKYSGQSMQRRETGSDSNDANLDWEIIPKATPGYHR